MDVDPDTGRTALTRDETEPWVQVALSARVMQRTLRQIPIPAPGSLLDGARAFFPDETAADWCRSFLAAALEHLVMWADYATPLKYHPEAAVEFALRPAQTLARAALESASQAVWVLSTQDVREASRRHVSLVLADWQEQGKAATDPEVKAKLTQRRADALRLVGGDEKKFRAPLYIDLVKDAAAHVRTQLPDALVQDDGAVERLWRASAGSAHGKRWPASELTLTFDAGGYHITMPDPAAITAILKLADAVMTYGVMRFADFSGHYEHLSTWQRAALAEVYGTLPLLPGAPAEPPNSTGG
ncbi:hypothetical protein [Microbacterium sp. AG238]|uniref:hypothetical protein n=1 Tax=Microbacterium sp. AG238 TaxID=2183994 RepID=UPI000E7096F1|nr:hypothetical protein [Microbacterium sp. AG238]RKE64912.1 hypothetical protein DEU36_2147 [Microbacterium sp. AG238]